MKNEQNRRILLIDDNESIHEDFKKILVPEPDNASALASMRAVFMTGSDPDPAEKASREVGGTKLAFEIVSALQGEDGYKALCDACDEGKPFALAFVDMRMPPGWDGVQTITKLWERDPDLQVVICTAFSDYTWEETVAELGQSDQLLILKKPFDAIEIYQLASALTEKWNMAVLQRSLLEDVRRAEHEARAYASSLETVNNSLAIGRAAAEMSATLKTEFLVQLSQEVSCRLGEVLGNVELLRSLDVASDGGPTEIETVLDIGQHLLHTIHQILDVTTLETGADELQVAECNPIEVVQSVLASQRTRAKAKGLTLEVRNAESIPSRIQTEERHLAKVLGTLVDNAVHHTDEGSIWIDMSIGSTESWQRPMMVFEVIDTGRGIPQDRLGKIFEPLARAEGDATRSGYGFHLALAKRLATQLGGDLTVRSEVGRGSSFALTIEAGIPTNHYRGS